MNINPIKINYNFNRDTACDIVNVSHSYNRGAKSIELSLCDGKSPVELGAECEASANFVREKDMALIAEGVECEITSDGKVLIPFDRKVFDPLSGIMKIEVIISSGERVIALPFPLRVLISGSVLESAEITEESQGTVVEVISGMQDDIEANAQELNALKTGLDGRISRKAIDEISNITYRSPDDYDEEEYAGWLVYDDGANFVIPLANLGDEFYGISGDYNDLANKPCINGKTIEGALTSGDLGINIPTKVSQLQNDSGYLTSHQSLAAYYTSAQVDAAIQTAIGGVENGSY